MAAGSRRSIQSEDFGRGTGLVGPLFILSPFYLAAAFVIDLAVRECSWFLSIFCGAVLLLLVFITVNLFREKRMLRRFGDMRLELSDEDARIGGRFTASLAVPPGLRVFDLEAALACFRVTHEARDRRRAEAVWASRPRVPVRDGRIDIAIDIPADLKASLPVAATQEARRNAVAWEWRLSITAPEAEDAFCYTYPVAVGEATTPPGFPVSTAQRDEVQRPQTAQPATAPALQVKRISATDTAFRAASPRSTASERRTLGAGRLLALVAVNSIPVAGAVFLGWRFQEAIALYWAEAVIMSLFAALYMLLSHDYTAMVDRLNRQREHQDLAPVQEANTPGQRISGFLGTALLYGSLCAITGAFIMAIPGPGGSTFWQGLMRHSGSLAVSVLLIAAYQCSVFLSDHGEHLLVRPMYRFGAIYAAMCPLIVALLIAPEGGPIVMLAFVLVKIWYEKKLREAELNSLHPGNAPTVADAIMHASEARQPGEKSTRHNGH